METQPVRSGRDPARAPKGVPAKTVLGVLLLVVIVAVAVDNGRSTRVGYVFGHASAPLFVVLLLAAIVGALTGWLLLHLPRARRARGAHDGRDHRRHQGTREGSGG